MGAAREVLRALFRAQRVEPAPFSRALTRGSVLAFLLVVLSGLDVWRGLVDLRDCTQCRLQEQSHNARLGRAQWDLETATDRKHVFEHALVAGPANPLYAAARGSLNEEERAILLSHDRIEGLRIKGRNEDLPFIVGMMLLGWVVVVAVGRAVLYHYRKVAGRDSIPIKADKSARRLVVSMALLLGLVHAAESTYTSIITVDKTWTTWFSFCQNPIAWGIQILAYGAACFAIVFPLAMGWAVSSSKLVPVLNLDHPDRHCGVGKYVLFLQTWTYLGVVASTGPVVLWLKWIMTKQRTMSYGYLPTSVAILAIVAIIVGRCIRCGATLRFHYEEELRKKFPTYTSFAAADVAPDPTTSFLGESWWKLPALILAIAALFWQIITLSGLVKLAGVN